MNGLGKLGVAVGQHSAPLPGLAPGLAPVILGEGLALRPDNGNTDDLPRGPLYPGGHTQDPETPPTTCA